jgi:hypothetical protein
VATPEKQRPTTLDEALAQLKRDPDHPVRARVGDLDVELRVVGGGVEPQHALFHELELLAGRGQLQ